jgi:hypothetical protein
MLIYVGCNVLYVEALQFLPNTMHGYTKTYSIILGKTAAPPF